MIQFHNKVLHFQFDKPLSSTWRRFAGFPRNRELTCSLRDAAQMALESAALIHNEGLQNEAPWVLLLTIL